MDPIRRVHSIHCFLVATCTKGFWGANPAQNPSLDKPRPSQPLVCRANSNPAGPKADLACAKNLDESYRGASNRSITKFSSSASQPRTAKEQGSSQ